jgi:hypothetical protein
MKDLFKNKKLYVSKHRPKILTEKEKKEFQESQKEFQRKKLMHRPDIDPKKFEKKLPHKIKKKAKGGLIGDKFVASLYNG